MLTFKEKKIILLIELNKVKFSLRDFVTNHFLFLCVIESNEMIFILLKHNTKLETDCKHNYLPKTFLKGKKTWICLIFIFKHNSITVSLLQTSTYIQWYRDSSSWEVGRWEREREMPCQEILPPPPFFSEPPNRFHGLPDKLSLTTLTLLHIPNFIIT